VSGLYRQFQHWIGVVEVDVALLPKPLWSNWLLLELDSNSPAILAMLY
jgi:hypothetical protein